MALGARGVVYSNVKSNMLLGRTIKLDSKKEKKKDVASCGHRGSGNKMSVEVNMKIVSIQVKDLKKNDGQRENLEYGLSLNILMGTIYGGTGDLHAGL